MVTPRTKFEISMLTHYKDMKGKAKCRNLGGLAVRGHLRSSAMSPFYTVHTTSHLTLVETMHLSCTIFELL